MAEQRGRRAAVLAVPTVSRVHWSGLVRTTNKGVFFPPCHSIHMSDMSLKTWNVLHTSRQKSFAPQQYEYRRALCPVEYFPDATQAIVKGTFQVNIYNLAPSCRMNKMS